MGDEPEYEALDLEEVIHSSHEQDEYASAGDMAISRKLKERKFVTKPKLHHEKEAPGYVWGTPKYPFPDVCD